MRGSETHTVRKRHGKNERYKMKWSAFLIIPHSKERVCSISLDKIVLASLYESQRQRERERERERDTSNVRTGRGSGKAPPLFQLLSTQMTNLGERHITNLY